VLKYFIKRILTLIPIILIVSFLVFWLMSLTGDPAAAMAGEYATAEDIELLRKELGLDKPLIVRYAKYMWDLVHGDMGRTLYGNRVVDEFSARYPNTMRLAFVSCIFTTVLAIPFGILAAIKQNTWVDTTLSGIAMAGISMPTFWVGLMLILLLSVRLGLLPATGSETWKHLIMPAFCLGINNAGLVCRMTRSSMVDVIRADYLRTARSKGVSEKDVILKHALKNALIPIITIIGSQFSILLGGASIIESVFAYNGLGQYTVSCIRGNEYIAATGIIIILTVITALVLLAVDILYAFVDPRIKARYTK